MRVADESHGHDVVVIGASAGGVEALKVLVRGLPDVLPASVLITLHTFPHGRDALAEVLQGAGSLPVTRASDAELIARRHIYVAPPNHHLLVENGRLRLSRGPKENGTRPAIDPMFRSAARSYGARVVAVVLSGGLDDGSAGIAAVKARGGCTIAQLPEDAMHPDMPRNAIATGFVDYVLPLAQIPEQIVKLVNTPAGTSRSWAGDEIDKEVRIAMMDPSVLENDLQPGEPSDYSCPDCGGVLRKINGTLVHFRCQVGHAWSTQALLVTQLDKIEDSLWVALRALEEHSKLTRGMLETAQSHGQTDMVLRLQEKLRDIARHQEQIRSLLLKPLAESSKPL